jgi:predicted AAA+ superfamily ATPase
VELLLVNSGGIFEGSAFAGPCEVSRTTEIVGAPKVYAFDTGLVRHARGYREARPEDHGAFWEHYVLNEIHARIPGVRPHCWRTKHQQEVDYVFVRGNAHPLAVECKWSEASLGDLRGLRAFVHAYPEAEALVVVPRLEREHTIGLGGTHRGRVIDLEGLIMRLQV